ncbi:deoxycytidylate deaminase [Streptomyces phage BoomerJR]|uniref:Deoxycytidylate deaminase n=3 Tax=Streptomyces virus Yaboi TaxID=2846408 RepID=A0A411C4T8_9CAUD|nr:deoxycytidylate deaminase [Streptomyces phage Genie2]QAY12840.1 deoxycytidylate deaminase [Streptomyces phage BoomerJR]UVD40034.1 deoxycytidylate deaminase [Streptomyces phage Stanimal]WNM73776.1 deoxycytidylate deaminase [Streptomyces phage Sollertia]
MANGESTGLSKKDRSFLSLAMELSANSNMKQKHGAVIVRSGRVLARGWNILKNNPENVSDEHIERFCSVHAEQMAIARCKKAAGAIIYIARNKDGQGVFSKPCSACEKAIRLAGIKRVIYTC